MAGKSSRDKGARGEREVIALLQPIVNRVCDTVGNPVRVVLKRNYTQRFAAKQYDVDGIPWLALEVKRVENGAGMSGWWKQTLAATRKGQVPVLFWRQNNGAWHVRTKMVMQIDKRSAIRATVDMTVRDWTLWFEQKLISEMSRSANRSGDSRMRQ